MRDASPWTRLKQGFAQDLRRVGDRLGPVSAQVHGSWRSLSLPYKLLFVVVTIGFLIILAKHGFPWDAFSIVVFSQAPWHVGAIGIGFVLIMLLLLLWRLPKRKAARLNLSLKEQFDFENETRKTWATIVGGMAILFSLLFTWGNLRVTQENLRITQEAATKSQELTREGQITDRFTKAIGQLGEQGQEKLAVRLGGIYALERIGRDSERDHWPIMEILTTYVRVHAPWPPKNGPPRQDDQSAAEIPPAKNKPASPKPVADIQAILTVLGRRTRLTDVGEHQRLDLTHTDLRGASLQGARLKGVNLGFAHLEGSSLAGAHLEGALLRHPLSFTRS